MSHLSACLVKFQTISSFFSLYVSNPFLLSLNIPHFTLFFFSTQFNLNFLQFSGKNSLLKQCLWWTDWWTFNDDELFWSKLSRIRFGAPTEQYNTPSTYFSFIYWIDSCWIILVHSLQIPFKSVNYRFFNEIEPCKIKVTSSRFTDRLFIDNYVRTIRSLPVYCTPKVDRIISNETFIIARI